MPDPTPSVDLAALARDIAIEYLRLPQILAAHGISDEMWAEISANTQFINMAAQMKREWASASNAKERVKMKAATAVEALMPTMLEEIVKSTTPASQKNDIYKTMVKLGELEYGNKDLNPTGERFVFNLNIAPGVAPTVTVETPPKLIEGEVVP